MPRFLVSIHIGLLAATACLAGGEGLANADLQGLYVNSLAQVLRLEPDQIDLAVAAFIVSEQWSDIVAGRRYLARLDDMAYQILEELEARNLPLDYRAIPVINRYLFETEGYMAVSEATDPNDLFLHCVMDNRRGYCLSLSMLYLCLAERLGLPLYGVVVPGHFFVRYDDGRVTVNIETTSNGAAAPDEHYIEKFKVPSDDGSGLYMRNLDKLQTLGCLFNNLGNTYDGVGDEDKAMEILEVAVDINPSLAEARMNLGNIYLKKGRLADAIYEYQAALKVNPGDAKAHLNLGNAYNERGWLPDAINEYTAAIKLDCGLTDGYKNLALVYTKQGKYYSALAQLKQAVAIEPTDAALYSRLGDVYMRMGDYDKAVSLHKKALEMNPGLAEAYHGLGLCYEKLGRPDEQIEAYKRALAINPNMVGALVNLANAYVSGQEYDLAIEYYRKALSLKPSDAMIHYNFGIAYVNKGDFEEAVRLYEKAVKIEPDMGDAHNGLAYGYYRLGKPDLALKHLNRARELGIEVDESLAQALAQKRR